MIAQAINSIAEHCGSTEDKKGFREPWKLADELDLLAENGGGIREGLEPDQREILSQSAAALRNLYVSSKLMLVVTELSEAMETLRDHSVEGITKGDGNFGEELVDAHIRLFALADLLGFEEQGVELLKKMNINVTRPYKHNRHL